MNHIFCDPTDEAPANAIAIDFDSLAHACGFTRSGLDERMFNLATKAIWSEARKIASSRSAEDAVSEDDLAKATRKLLG